MGPYAMILVVFTWSFKPAFLLSSPSSRGSLVLLHLLPLRCHHLHMWGYWCFPRSWLKLGIHPAWHFTWCTLHSASQSQRKSTLNIHWKDWCWSWSSNTLATWCDKPTHQKRPWCWERLKAGGKGDNRGWDGWMASLTQWTWVWANSGRWWRTGNPGMLQFMESQSRTQLSNND